MEEVQVWGRWDGGSVRVSRILVLSTSPPSDLRPVGPGWGRVVLAALAAFLILGFVGMLASGPGTSSGAGGQFLLLMALLVVGGFYVLRFLRGIFRL